VGAGPADKPQAVALAATDPANPYGAALPWPERVVEDAAADTAPGTGHRPGRKAGAMVVLVDGSLAVYVERGGRTLLTFADDPDVVSPAMTALATAVRQGALGRLTVERADGENILATGEHAGALRQALESAGFVATPRGLRLRG
jgi:ATP-dependent Lhr-like helicase